MSRDRTTRRSSPGASIPPTGRTSIRPSLSALGALVIDSSWGTSGGAITVNVPLTLDGLNDGNSGQWSSGNTITLDADLINNGTFTLTGSGTQGLFVGGVTAHSLVNQGTIVQVGPSNLTLNGAAVLDNQGSYTFQGDGDITGVLNVVYASTVINSGTITKAAGTGNSVINVTTFNNSGTFDVATGTLTLQPSNGTFTGGASADFNVADGAVLNLLNGGIATFTGSISGVPTGSRKRASCNSAAARWASAAAAPPSTSRPACSSGAGAISTSATAA